MESEFRGRLLRLRILIPIAFMMAAAILLFALVIALPSGGKKDRRADREIVIEPQRLLADTAAFRSISPEEAESLDADSTAVTLGLNCSFQKLKSDSNIALVTHLIFATEFDYPTLLRLDSLGFMSDDKEMYVITRQVLVRGRDSSEVAYTLDHEAIVWHQSLPAEMSNYCVIPKTEKN